MVKDPVNGSLFVSSKLNKSLFADFLISNAKFNKFSNCSIEVFVFSFLYLKWERLRYRKMIRSEYTELNWNFSLGIVQNIDRNWDSELLMSLNLVVNWNIGNNNFAILILSVFKTNEKSFMKWPRVVILESDRNHYIIHVELLDSLCRGINHWNSRFVAATRHIISSIAHPILSSVSPLLSITLDSSPVIIPTEEFRKFAMRAAPSVSSLPFVATRSRRMMGMFLRRKSEMMGRRWHMMVRRRHMMVRRRHVMMAWENKWRLLLLFLFFFVLILSCFMLFHFFIKSCNHDYWYIIRLHNFKECMWMVNQFFTARAKIEVAANWTLISSTD